MTCEEFEALGSELAPDFALDAPAQAHLRCCPRCLTLHESWLELQDGLRAWARETQRAEAPLRVQTALLAAVRVRRPRSRRSLLVPGWLWGLGTAAAILVFLAWSLRERPKERHTAAITRTQPQAIVQQAAVATTAAPRAPRKAGAVRGVAASSERPRRRSQEPSSATAPEVSPVANEFIVLPYSTPAMPGDDGAVVRMQMQRGALSMLGLPVNEERAGEWIQVDLLLGPDGQPQAVRLARQLQNGPN